MANFAAVKTNSKGIDAAIDIVEEAISHLERRAAETGRPALSSSSMNEKKLKVRKKRREKPKKSVCGALIRHSKSAKSSSHAKRRSSRVRNNENLLTPEENRKSEDDSETRIMDSLKTRPCNSDPKSMPRRRRYTEATLSHQLKVQVQKRAARQPPLKSLQLPFVSSVSHSKSHHLGTIIQENFGRLKQTGLNEYGQGCSIITPEVVQRAVENVDKEIRRLRKKNK